MVKRANQQLGADGKVWDYSDAANFDYAAFFRIYEEQQYLQMSKDELAWMMHFKPEDVQKADVLLNLSCGAQWAPHHFLQTIDVLKALGVNYAAVAGRQYCCGRIYQRFGREEDGDKMIAKSLGRMSAFEPKDLVQICGSCQIEFDYAIEKRKEDGNPTGYETIHLTKFIGDVLAEMGDRIPWKKKINRRVLVHGHLYDDAEATYHARMLETIALIPGVEVVGELEPSSYGLPCKTTKPGGPSIFWDLAPEDYRKIQAEYEAQADAVGADAWCHTYTGCTTHWARIASPRLPSLHYLQILGEALGCPQPDRYYTLWRLADPKLMLEQSRAHWESWGLTEEKAKSLIERYFTPKYQAGIQRCPCDGNCNEAKGIACETSGTAWVQRGKEQLPVIARA